MSQTSVPMRQWLLAGLCAAALTMGACGGASKTSVEEISVETASLGLSGADENELGRHFALQNRSGSASESERLLTELGLAKEGLSVGERVIDGADVTYTDWRIEEDETIVTAETVRIYGLHEVDGEANFDAIQMEGLTLNTVEDGGEADDRLEGTVGSLSVVGPTPRLAQELAYVLLGEESEISDPDPLTQLSNEESFQAMRLEDVNLSAVGDDDGTASIKQLIVGNDQDAGRMDAVVERVKLDWDLGDVDGNRLTLDMDGFTVIGFDTEQAQGDMFNPLASLSTTSLSVPYEQVNFGAMTLDMPAFGLTMEGMEAEAETNGNVTTMRSVLKPMELTLKDSLPQLAPYMESLKENGLDVLTLRGTSVTELDRRADRMTVSEARMDIDGGLRLDCNYSLLGLAAAEAKMEESGVTMPNFSQLESDEDFEAMIEQMNAFQAAQQEANSLIKLEGLNCDVQDVADNSLVNRGYAVASDVTGSPVSVLKGSAKTMIALGSLTAQSQAQRDLMDRVGSGLIDFLDNPGQTMTITIDPDEPVSITQLTPAPGQTPDPEIVNTLGLSVTVK